MKINDYYLQELNSFRRLGEEFAHKNPGLAPYLAKEGQDPDVERMLEGFAFLTGRLRQQLDEQLPEVSYSLAQLLWPNYIRPIPSYTIIAYEPLREQTVAQMVERGSEIQSEATKEGVGCKFRTCYDTTVHPLELVRSAYHVYGSKGELELDFAMSTQADLGGCKMESMRLYLNATRIVSEELYVYLLEYVESIALEVLDFNNQVLETVNFDAKGISPVGFAKDEKILPYPHNVFDGYTVLQEYFAYAQKHLFVDIPGLDVLQRLDEKIVAQSRSFRLKFRFSKRFNAAQQVIKDDFILYATPAVNLYESDAIPIRKTPLEEEYILTPSEFERHESEVFSVESARGWIPSKHAYEDFLPFESFGYNEEDEYYSIKVKLSDDRDRTHSSIRFASGEGVFEKNDYDHATVSVRLLATNRSLPSTLRLGQVCISDPHSQSAHLKFKNITLPTQSYPPPIGDDFLWRMISNMSLNYLSLSDIKTLRAIVGSYDFFSQVDHKAKIKNTLMLKGLVSIRHEKSEMIFEGFPIRGINTFLEIDVSKFTGVGEAYLFCSVLNEFFALYSSINAFHRMEVVMMDHGHFSWEPKMGQQTIV